MYNKEVSHLSRMKRIRSFAKRVKLDNDEIPNRARVKKKTPKKNWSVYLQHICRNRQYHLPNLFWKPGMSFLKQNQYIAKHEKQINTNPRLWKNVPQITLKSMSAIRLED